MSRRSEAKQANEQRRRDVKAKTHTGVMQNLAARLPAGAHEGGVSYQRKLCRKHGCGVSERSRTFGSMREMLTLNVVESRVLGALIEKGITTPEYYPLSLNALVNACNQKSSRDPVMELSEAEVRTALFELEQMGLVRVLSDARVSKFEHLTYGKLGLGRPEIAVLGLLLLRGPQTSAELRARAERMYTFDDNAAVIAVLERLAAREEPLVVQVARQPGSREARWMHLLSGSVEGAAAVGNALDAGEPHIDAGERLAALEATVRSLEERMRALEEARG